MEGIAGCWPAVMRAAGAAWVGGLLLFASDVFAGTVEPQPKIGAQINGLNATEQDRFDKGRVQFERVLTISDGLGPVFNRESCVACHINPSGGSGTQTVIRFATFDGITYDGMVAQGGPLLSLSATDVNCIETIPPGANLFVERTTPSGIGTGLIEAIDDADILALEDPLDLDANGISGEARIVSPFEAPGTRVGRFGWKAGFATLTSFSADAARNESGLTNIFIPFEIDPNGSDPPSNGAPDNCDTVGDPEDVLDADGFYYFERSAQFLRFTAAPPQTPKSGHPGEAIFTAVGCNLCHTNEFVTSNDPSISESLRGVTIRPYSDFLLHDMGTEGDPMIEASAGMGEVRTPALWGMRIRESFWHDGSATGDSFEDRARAAINKHGGAGSESLAVYNAFDALSPADQDELIAFLGTLGRREFDADGDNILTLLDFFDFRDCQGGGPYAPGDPCAVHDVDQDGDVDADDFDAFLVAYDGSLVDCNGNSNADLGDIVAGGSSDVNSNAIPDECDCSADCRPENGDGTFGNGFVNVDDLLAVINAFGSTGENPCDVAPKFIDGTFGNQMVNVDDLLEVINAFGPCF